MTGVRTIALLLAAALPAGVALGHHPAADPVDSLSLLQLVSAGAMAVAALGAVAVVRNRLRRRARCAGAEASGAARGG